MKCVVAPSFLDFTIISEFHWSVYKPEGRYFLFIRFSGNNRKRIKSINACLRCLLELFLETNVKII